MADEFCASSRNAGRMRRLCEHYAKIWSKSRRANSKMESRFARLLNSNASYSPLRARKAVRAAYGQTRPCFRVTHRTGRNSGSSTMLASQESFRLRGMRHRHGARAGRAGAAVACGAYGAPLRPMRPHPAGAGEGGRMEPRLAQLVGLRRRDCLRGVRLSSRFAALVPDEGIEPPTFGLQNRCSTAELIRLPTRRGNTSRVHSSQDGLITARNVYQCAVPMNLCAFVGKRTNPHFAVPHGGLQI